MLLDTGIRKAAKEELNYHHQEMNVLSHQDLGSVFQVEGGSLFSISREVGRNCKFRGSGGEDRCMVLKRDDK